MTTITNTVFLNNLLLEWQNLLQGWALDGSLEAAAQQALMLQTTPGTLQNLLAQWSSGNFRSLPPIVLLSSEEMNGAMGAYAISTGNIYINGDWLVRASKEKVFAVLTEELGHHLDGLLNPVDSPGDEGEYFSRLLSGEVLDEQTIDLIRVQNDTGTINLSGISVLAENASGTQDYTPPVLQDVIVGFNPDKKCFYISVSATDDLSGVAFVGAGIESAINPQTYQQINLSYDSNQVRWIGEFPLSSEAPDGEYILRRVYLLDGVGNTVNYGNNWGVLLETVPVTGSLYNPNPPLTTDTTPPSIQLVEQRYDAESNCFEITVTITDGGSGAGEVRARITSVNSPSNCYDIALNVGNDGLFHGTIPLNDYSPNGTWVVNRIVAFDQSRNYANAGSNWSTTPVEISTTGELVNPGTPLSDEIQPILSSLRYECDLQNSKFNIYADIIESGSGVAFAQAWIRSQESPDNRQIINLTFNAITHLWEGTYQLLPLSPDGTWTLERFLIRDAANNLKDYPNSEVPGSESLNNVSISGTLTALSNASSFLMGSAGNDLLTGAAASDTLYALDGNDTVNAGGGNDLIIGGSGKGDDIYNGESGTDTIKYSSATVYGITVNLAIGTASGTEIGNDTLYFVENVIGGQQGDLITGSSVSNVIDGAGGADSMAGGAGNDTYVVDTTGDVISEAVNAGADTVKSSISYTLGANLENLILTDANAVNGTGNSLRNSLTGNAAANILDGKSGADSMAGAAGDDTYVVDNTSDVVVEDLGTTNGIDLVQSSVSYTISDVDVENLTLTGTSSINGTGNASANTIIGNSGANILVGSTSADVLTGGLGADTFRVALADSRLASMDWITDFVIGTDKLDGPTAVSTNNTKKLGQVTTLDQSGISAVLTSTDFGANKAATFTFVSDTSTRTFVALNDGTPGFSSTSDGLIEITGFTGLLTNLAIV